jgi:hypothetical protein
MAARLAEDGIDARTLIEAARVSGRWPDGAWVERSTSPADAPWESLARWSGTVWVSPSGPASPNVHATGYELLSWEGAHVVVVTLREGKPNTPWGRGCLAFQRAGDTGASPSLPTAICTGWMQSGPFLGDTLIPAERGRVCRLGIEEVAAAGGTIEVQGELCALGGRAIWRDGAWHAIATLPRVQGFDVHVFARWPDGATRAARVVGYDGNAPRALLFTCTERACTLLGARPLQPDLVKVNTELSLLRDVDGAVLVLAGQELARWNERTKALERDELPAPVTDVAIDGQAAFAIADGKLFERRAGAWQSVPLPAWQERPLSAVRVASRDGDPWVVASYPGGACADGTVILRRSIGAPTLFCVRGALQPAPPIASSQPPQCAQTSEAQPPPDVDALLHAVPACRALKELLCPGDPRFRRVLEAAGVFDDPSAATDPKPACVQLLAAEMANPPKGDSGSPP